MGATNFSHIQVGRGGARELYREAVEEALYEDGHDPYNGTISTTRGFKNLTSTAPRFGTKAFNKWEDDVIENDKFGIEKWGPAACIEIKGASLKKLKERYGYKGKRGIKAFYFFGWAAC